MRIFQNSGLYPSYRRRLKRLTRSCESFDAYKKAFIEDRFGACHFLKPVLDHDAGAFFTNGDDDKMQRLWSRERGMKANLSLEDILLAQIEEHRTDVFYNMDPIRFGSSFVKKLPGCVKRTITWRAAPSGSIDIKAYDILVCNFPALLNQHIANGGRAAFFSPAHDPVMDLYACNQNRPIDVVFVGGYSRYHTRRAKVLETVASQNRSLKIKYLLDQSKLTKLASSAIGGILPLSKYRLPACIKRIASGPTFGVDLYKELSESKIVLNGAVDMIGEERGNMRCFEAMGCGAHLLSDEGKYPEGMVPQETLSTYDSAETAKRKIIHFMEEYDERNAIANAGYKSVSSRYSKEKQWENFLRIAEY